MTLCEHGHYAEACVTCAWIKIAEAAVQRLSVAAAATDKDRRIAELELRCDALMDRIRMLEMADKNRPTAPARVPFDCGGLGCGSQPCTCQPVGEDWSTAETPLHRAIRRGRWEQLKWE